ncbi:uL13 family ribosomal protein [Tunturiibacter gelidiferens]|uniref:uL13 family ribosomal protein n=1 Tax=Tunturiibacter gelidiferens TaxID=3069689 RepID=UPI003D9BE5E2
MSTTIPSGKDIKRKWYVLDASGKTLGRLATQAASVLAGKTNPSTPLHRYGRSRRDHQRRKDRADRPQV